MLIRVVRGYRLPRRKVLPVALYRSERAMTSAVFSPYTALIPLRDECCRPGKLLDRDESRLLTYRCASAVGPKAGE